ncbi:MAG: hypothetical protein R2822_03160 [Spirosomataceae bacterium]
MDVMQPIRVTLQNTIVFTVCNAEQYPYTKVLAESLPANCLFKVGIIEGHFEDLNTVSVANLPFPVLTSMRSRYDDAAFSAAVMPFLGEYFLQQEGIEKVIYFDPTIQVLSNLQAVLAPLQSSDILLTPRITKKFSNALYGDEKLFLNSGMYDAGFWAVSKTKNSLNFLEWWQNRLIDRAHFDLCHAMNHAQLWLNYVPIYFEKVAVVKNIGWNVSLQNLHERVLTKQNKKWMVNLVEPLVFVNFKEMLHANKISLSASETQNLINQYLIALKKNSPTSPATFSLYQTTNHEKFSWKDALSQQIQRIIDLINHFPLYH